MNNANSTFNRWDLLIYISFLVIILLQIMRYYINTRTLSNQDIYSFSYLVAEIPSHCWFRSGLISFRIPRCDQYRLGDNLHILGRIDQFSANPLQMEISLAVQEIIVLENIDDSGFCLKCVITRVRQYFREQSGQLLSQSLPANHAQLVLGMIWGGSNQFSQAFRHQIEVTGLQHVVAASGSNVALVSILAWPAISMLPKKLRPPCLLFCHISYMIVAGFDPPLLRAVLMVHLSLFASVYLHRKITTWWALVLAASLMLFIRPAYWWSVSWQLSMTASAGLVALTYLQKGNSVFTWLAQGGVGQIEYDYTKAIFYQVGKLLSDSFWATLAAQWLVAPLLALHFGQISLVSVFANTVLVPLTESMTLSSAVFLSMVAVSEWWGSGSWWLSWLVWWQVDIFVTGVELFGQLDQWLVTLSVTWTVVLGWWLLSMYLFWRMWRARFGT